jgi:hypothetical protein
MDSARLKFMPSAEGKFRPKTPKKASMARGGYCTRDTCTVGQSGSKRNVREQSLRINNQNDEQGIPTGKL